VGPRIWFSYCLDKEGRIFIVDRSAENAIDRAVMQPPGLQLWSPRMLIGNRVGATSIMFALALPAGSELLGSAWRCRIGI
jgi:hypothetical protein